MSNLRWAIRWHLKQRQPRPAWGERPIDYIAPAAHGVLFAAAIIFVIGG